jgi:hypothetical protein
MESPKPITEVEVSPEMIEAAMTAFYQTTASGFDDLSEEERKKVLSAVYRAMYEARSC